MGSAYLSSEKSTLPQSSTYIQLNHKLVRSSIIGMARAEKELMKVRQQYGHGGPYCLICGRATNSVSVKCEACMEKALVAEELEYVRDCLRMQPNPAIELAHDKRRLVHLVLFRSPKLVWCGAPVTQKKSERRTAKPGAFADGLCNGLFPMDLCNRCFAAYQGMV